MIMRNHPFYLLMLLAALISSAAIADDKGEQNYSGSEEQKLTSVNVSTIYKEKSVFTSDHGGTQEIHARYKVQFKRNRKTPSQPSNNEQNQQINQKRPFMPDKEPKRPS